MESLFPETGLAFIFPALPKFFSLPPASPAYWRLTTGLLCVFDRSPEGRDHPAARAASSSRWVQGGPAGAQRGRCRQVHSQLSHEPSRILGQLEGGKVPRSPWLPSPGTDLPNLCAGFRLSAPGTLPSQLLPHPPELFPHGTRTEGSGKSARPALPLPEACGAWELRSCGVPAPAGSWGSPRP